MPKNTLLTESKLFDAEEVEKKTELIIQYLDEENYQEIKKLSIEKLADMMNKKEMDQVKSHLGKRLGRISAFWRSIPDRIKQDGTAFGDCTDKCFL